jgi:hypothetical protein
MKHLKARSQGVDAPGDVDKARRRLRPEGVFALIALTAGIVMVFATGPFQAPDETSHFYRAFQISHGRIIAERYDTNVGA